MPYWRCVREGHPHLVDIPGRARGCGRRRHLDGVRRGLIRLGTARGDEHGAAMSMARLWRDQGKRDAARDLLAPVYGSFTEGFDTLDLKKAKGLLDELHA
jgi:predicted ATPase